MLQQNIYSSIRFLVLLFLSGLVSCTSPSLTPTLESTTIPISTEIKIGVIAPSSGSIAYAGQSTVEAAEMAVAEINENGGLKVGKHSYTVTLVIKDNKDDTNESVGIMQEFVHNEEIMAVVGPQASRNAIPASKWAEEGKLPMISPWSTDPDTTFGKKYVFRAAFVDSFQGKVMAQFAFDDLDIDTKKAAILFDKDSDYNRGIATVFNDEFEKAGGEVVAFESYRKGDQEFERQLKNIKDSKAEILFLPNYKNEIPLQVKQVRDMKIKIAIIGSDSWAGIEASDLTDLEGAYYSGHYAPDIPNEITEKFVEKYRQLYDDRIPDDVAALTYDAFGLLFEAIESQDEVNREAIREGLAGIRNYQGVTGTIGYEDGTGDPVKSVVILKVEDGKAKFYQLVNP
jgi:branched-chain amino acid transport system substrate-binding protein